jgi:hypothetical protein
MQTGSGASASRLPTVITAIAVVLAVIGLGGVVTGAADEPSDKVDSSTRTTFDGDGGDGGDGGDIGGSSSTLAGGTTTTTTPGASTTTAKPTATTSKSTATTSLAACPIPPAATADPGAQQPPALGTYTYMSCSNTAETTDMKVAAGASGNGVTRRLVSETEDGFGQTTTYAFGPSGVLLESLTVQSPQGPFTCDWNPDVVNYPPSLTLGKEWTAKSSCQLRDDKGVSRGQLELDGTGKVTGRVQVNIGGTNVNAWVIEGVIKLKTTVTGFGSQTATVTSKDYYDPTRGIDLYRHAEGTTGPGGDEVRDERLTSLAPKT